MGSWSCTFGLGGLGWIDIDARVYFVDKCELTLVGDAPIVFFTVFLSFKCIIVQRKDVYKFSRRDYLYTEKTWRKIKCIFFPFFWGALGWRG